jgi:hypothetical protein
MSAKGHKHTNTLLMSAKCQYRTFTSTAYARSLIT